MFGRKKIAKVVQSEDLESTSEQENENNIEEPQLPQVSKPVIKQEQTAKCRIVAAELTDAGLYRSVIISTKSIGEVGVEFEI